MSDLIDEFVGIVRPYCDSPDCFIEAGGYYLVSDLLGRFFACSSMPQRGKPNVWVIMSSIPGRMRRSTIQHYTEYVRRKALKGFYEATHVRPNLGDAEKELTPEEKAEFVRKYREALIHKTTIEEGTPEGIMDKIEDAGQREFAILSTEIGSVLRRMGTRDYQIGVSTLLSKLYYGEGGSIALSRRSGKGEGRTIPEDLYVTMYAGMQEPKWYLDMSMVRQGLLRRIMILYVEPEELKRWMPPVQEGREQIYPELTAFSDKLAERMTECNRRAGGRLMPILMRPKVADSLNNMARKLDMMLKEDPSNMNIFRQSVWEHHAKLSMLRAIAEGKLRNTPGMDTPGVTVSPENFERAKSLVRPMLEKAEKIIESMGEQPQPVRTYGEAIEMIHRAIVAADPEGIRHSDLYLCKKGMKASDLNQYVGTLIKQGRIVSFEKNTGGRTGKFYKGVDKEV